VRKRSTNKKTYILMKLGFVGGGNDDRNTCLQRIESLGFRVLSERGREMSEEAWRRTTDYF